MIMNDIIIEEIVKKHKTAKDKLTMLGTVSLCVLLVVILYMVVLPLVPQFSAIVFMLIALAIYFTYILSGNFNLEYEYALVNYELDIDKIASKKYRKKVTSVDLKSTEAFDRKALPEFEKYLNDGEIEKVYACRMKDEEDTHFLIYTENLVKKMLIFLPGEEMVAAIKKLTARRIQR